MVSFLFSLLIVAQPVLSAHFNFPLHPHLVPRQGCDSGEKECGSGCIPSDGVCCDSYYCDAPRQCDGAGGCTCLDTELACGGGCAPGDAVCCNDGKYCDAGEFCAPVAGYCCDDGEDPTTCANRQGFTIPASTATVASTTFVATSSSSSVGVPETSIALVSSSDSIPASSSVLEITSSSTALLPSANLSNIVTGATRTSTSSIAEFTGAAVKKDSVVGAILMGVLGMIGVL
ncbi:hypothetical protein K491DRAFT_699417 [Lophiostoma macrostomum CBS 122681]|uniref:Carbohydrate-binding module family 18 protein n=1 Tax=Lophiostoma macrostomum CBS 122681 TaxID=1314788 RepID=A0A6A6SLD2_9PLEO|nr:hypothetical protein K491DRAFT_699417 [Lophiostoma macrostomum CBS 122681]